MKSLLVLCAAVMSTNAFAAEVQSAKYNAAKKAIELVVSYGGGCKEHKFKLDMGACQESSPVSCEANLVDLTQGDFCEAYLTKTVLITLKEAGLNNSYYSGASITIKGDGDTESTLTLPRF
jgi:hypothetical protein